MWLRLSNLKWDTHVINDPTVGPVLAIKYLLRTRWLEVRLHKVIQPDEPEKFHSHPAYAVRVILSGGYQEALYKPDRKGRLFRTWRPGHVGLVTPSYTHRLHKLLNGPSYSLWLRGPRIRPVFLRGQGWPLHQRDKGDAL